MNLVILGYFLLGCKLVPILKVLLVILYLPVLDLEAQLVSLGHVINIEDL